MFLSFENIFVGGDDEILMGFLENIVGFVIIEKVIVMWVFLIRLIIGVSDFFYSLVVFFFNRMDRLMSFGILCVKLLYEWLLSCYRRLMM